MLAELLGWSQATFAASLNIDGTTAEVERETDAGTEVIKIQLPAVVSADLRLNAPRYPKLPNIMKAKKKPLDTKSPADYGVDTAPRLTTTNVSEPPVRQAGEKVEALVRAPLECSLKGWAPVPGTASGTKRSHPEPSAPDAPARDAGAPGTRRSRRRRRR